MKKQVNIKLETEVINEIDNITKNSVFFKNRTKFVEFVIIEKLKEIRKKDNNSLPPQNIGGGL